MTFEYFAYYAITSFGQAATTFISQNFAAGNLSRCRKTLRICLVLSFLSCACITVPLTIFRYQASEMFTSSPQEIKASCLRIMLILISSRYAHFMKFLHLLCVDSVTQPLLLLKRSSKFVCLGLCGFLWYSDTSGHWKVSISYFQSHGWLLPVL